MFLALALAALNQDKRLRPSPMFRAQENSPTKTVGYEYILRVTMRQQQELFRSIPGEVVAPSEEVVAAPVSSPAGVSSSTGGTLPEPGVAPALSFQLRDTAQAGAIGPAADGGQRQPATQSHGADA